MPSTEFTFPRADQRVVVIGASGTGKTVFAAWLLSHARFDKRPWIILDYKNEILWENSGLDRVLQPLRVGKLPGKRDKGLFIANVKPGQEDEVEDWLWAIWSRGNIGLFADEASLIPKQNAYKAILRQGRSKLIPVISCTQRPIDIDREVFTEASFVSLFRLQDTRDYKVVEYFTGMRDLRDAQLPKHWSRWYVGDTGGVRIMKPCPPPDQIVDRLRENVPYKVGLFG